MFSIMTYLTFGASTESVVFLNLPDHDPMSIATKICYFICVMGSNVVMLQPIYSLLENYDWYTNIEMVGEQTKFVFFRVLVIALAMILSLIIPGVQ